MDQSEGTLQWQWAGDASWNDYTIDGSGAFSLTDIDTTGRSGNQSLVIKARDLNGDENQESLTLLNDGTGVNMTISQPSSGESYATVVYVELDISDYTDLAASDYLNWELTGQGASGTFTDNSEGNYSTYIDTSGLYIGSFS